MKNNSLIPAMISTILILILSTSGCIDEDPKPSSNVERFKVTCSNNDNNDHAIRVIITNDENIEIYNATVVIQPKSTVNIYENKYLSQNEYFVKMIVNGNWTDTIKHYPCKSNEVKLSIFSDDVYDLFIQHKD